MVSWMESVIDSLFNCCILRKFLRSTFRSDVCLATVNMPSLMFCVTMVCCDVCDDISDIPTKKLNTGNNIWSKIDVWLVFISFFKFLKISYKITFWCFLYINKMCLYFSFSIIYNISIVIMKNKDTCLKPNHE